MKQLSACSLDCPDACSLVIERTASSKIIIRGNPAHPFTKGFICPKAKYAVERTRSKHRITEPLLRNGAGWKEIEWDAALDLCAKEIRALRQQPASILHVHGEGNKGLSRLASHYFFAVMGATGLRGSVCDETGIAACISDFGSLDCNDISTLAESRRIVNWGKDLSRSSVHVAALVRDARKQGGRVLTISPGGDSSASYSDQTIRIRPGTDRFLAAAVILLLLENDLIDRMLLSRANYWPQFEQLLRSRTLDQLAVICQVDIGAIETLYQWYASPDPTATVIGYGLQRHRYGGENVRFINALAFLSGKIGVPGGGSTFNISSVRSFNLDWLHEAGTVNRRTLLLPALGREIEAADDPPIRMIWVNGTNVVNQTPESKKIAAALGRTPFTVVVDAFMTDTADAADLILPCTLMLEEEDVVSSFCHDYVNYAGAVLNPPAGPRGDLEILVELGKRLDPPIRMPGRRELLDRLLRGPVLNVSLEELKQRGFVKAERADVAFRDLQFAHPDGKYRLPTELHPEPDSPAAYPIRLLTAVRKRFIHSQILPEDQETPPQLTVSPKNPCLERLDLNRPVFLASPLGRMEVRLQTDRTLHSTTAIYRRGNWGKLGGGANRIIEAMVTDMGEGTAYYSQHVRLEN